MGGGEIALLNLVKNLDLALVTPVILLFSKGPLASRLREAGFETHILSLSPNVLDTRKDSLGLATLLRVSIAFRVLLHIFQVARFTHQHQIDLVHTNSLKSDIIGGLAGRLAHRRVIWHIRDRIDSDYLPKSVVRAFRILARWIPNNIIAISQATLKTLQLPADFKHARVIYDGTPLIALTDRHPGARSNPLIGLVGRISPWKGQHIFLRAAAQVRQRFPNARFQIIGSALFSEQQYESQVRALASELNLTDAVEFTGFRTDVPALIQNLDILVHASTLGEPFGQVVIEGMAAAKPVIATRGGGIPEIVIDGETGILIPMNDAPAMADAISELLSDNRRRNELGSRGRRRTQEHFTIERTARTIELFYKSCAASNKSGS